MTIQVVDREYRGGPATFIGRSGILGNPYTLSTSPRLPEDKRYIVQTVEEIRGLYKLHLLELWDTDEYFYLVILSLAREHQRGHTVTFSCVDPEIGNILRSHIEEISAFVEVEEEKPEPEPVAFDQAQMWIRGEEDPF